MRAMCIDEFLWGQVPQPAHGFDVAKSPFLIVVDPFSYIRGTPVYAFGKFFA